MKTFIVKKIKRSQIIIFGASTAVFALFIFLFSYVYYGDTILIESQESKTENENPVYNKIRWIQMPDKDIWMMQQSHHGKYTNPNKWDRLAIVVDMKSSPLKARYYQLEPGELNWQEPIPEKKFKVSCFLCHSNGLRVIRPNYASSLHSHAWIDRMKIFIWNLRIKSYGRIHVDPIHNELDTSLEVPFRFRGIIENEAIKIKKCILCHKESGLFARGTLYRQNLPTIRFMLQSGHMPPFGLSLSETERKDLDRFLNGF